MPSQLQLSRAHRAGQDQISRALANLLLAQYRRYISTGATQAQIEQWLNASVPLVMNYHSRSAGLAETFYARSRTLLDDGTAPDARATSLVEEGVQTSLMVTGVVGLMNKLEAKMPPAMALKQSGEAAAGAAIRHALDGGRSYIEDVVRKDSLAVGYYRMTKDDCCSFCAVLASRGAVYKEDSFRDSDPQFVNDPEMPSPAKVHDKCHCSFFPVFERGATPLDGLPDSSRAFRDLWDAVVNPGGRTRYTGKDALNAFRTALYESRTDAVR